MIEFGRFLLDLKRRVLLLDGAPVELQSRPFDILAYLIGARERVVSREELLARVWQGQIVAENNLTVQMSILRRALADCGASGLIITVPGRGYRFVGEVSEAAQAVAPTRAAAPMQAEPAPLPAARTWDRRPWMAPLAVLSLLAIGLGGWRALRHPPAPQAMVALVSVDVDPDTVTIEPDGWRPVDYVFTVQNDVDLQLETEDIQFYLPSGQAVGSGNMGGRIFHGSFPIRGRSTGVYHNHIWLPPEIAAVAQASGGGAVQLKHIFHLRDTHGGEVVVPAVLRIELPGAGR